ncbi:hypothetical protein SCACP_27340 [Sporomusa carbonis]|uniref:PadR family transcriptional regulator n=1 Tax=Sporomusa carbonis TaxID=3076075 RepID=UPI003A5D31CC
MPPIDNESKTLIKTVTALFILQILARQSAYGNQIAAEIKRVTERAVQPNPNFLYPLLRQMEQDGYIEGQWENPDTRGKRIYTITQSGHAYRQALKGIVHTKLLELERRHQAIKKFLFEN